MGMNQTPSGERLHIAFLGKRNAGKSSLVNAVTGQKLAIVSDVKGTTTDPVYKSMELLPLGPVVIIDTPGIDDHGELGLLRVSKARQVINKTDIAVIAADCREGLGEQEQDLISLLKKKEIPYIVAFTKADLCPEIEAERKKGHTPENEVFVSSNADRGIQELKELIGKAVSREGEERKLVSDLLRPSDIAVLVVPIDKAAPKGRLILPQQQVIRDCLDCGASAVVCKENQLEHMLSLLKENVKLVITDSQVFPAVDKMTPPHILMTSFSVLFARYKGNLAQAASGARALDYIKNGDKILMCEGCTHHRQCGDIGTEKLPAWIRKYTKAEPEFVFTSGVEFPEDISGFALVIHCGGCMLNQREMKYRLAMAGDQNIPVTNYGTAIAYMNGILERSLEPFSILAGQKF